MANNSFEESLSEIESIIEDLEEGSIPLKESITKFKEGVKLLKLCNEELKESEMSIQKIVDKNGKISFEDIEMELDKK